MIQVRDVSLKLLSLQTMPNFQIRATNFKFISQSKVDDQPEAEEAMAVGVRGAVAILADEIEQGSKASAIELTVHDSDDQAVLRCVVTLSVAPLLVEQSATSR